MFSKDDEKGGLRGESFIAPLLSVDQAMVRETFFSIVLLHLGCIWVTVLIVVEFGAPTEADSENPGISIRPNSRIF